jgi:hypothetical protein
MFSSFHHFSSEQARAILQNAVKLREIVAKLTATGYQWEIGEHARVATQMPITYLIGYPRARP